MIRKFKLMKNMIVYLQKVPLFGKYCFYGCYCFSKGPKNLLVDAGNGKPLDGPDNSCRHHLVGFNNFWRNYDSCFYQNCHSCAKRDYGEEKCAVTNGYRFAAKEDPVTGIRWIECLNNEGSCKRALCECDKTLGLFLKYQNISIISQVFKNLYKTIEAYDLADAEGEWNILHHARWGGFDAPLNCARHQPGGRDGGLRQEPLTEVSIRFFIFEPTRLRPFFQYLIEIVQVVTDCCGEFPRRYPYHLDDGFGNVKRCCNGKTYDPNRLECCNDGRTHAIGNCPDM